MQTPRSSVTGTLSKESDVARTDAENRPRRGRQVARVVVAVVLLLPVVGGFASGLGPGVGIVGLVALVAGGWALIRGRAEWTHLASRRAGLLMAVAGFVAVALGGALTPAPTPTTDAAAGAAVPTSSAAPRTTHSAVGIPNAPVTTTEPVITAAPVTMTAPVNTTAPVSSSPLAQPAAPTIAMTCPADGSNASPVFAQQISATSPYTVVIDYGDGDRYSNDDRHLSAIFTHTYKFSGNFPVSAVLTDAAGQTTSTSCLYNWAKPVQVSSSSSTSSSGSGSSSSGSSSSSGDTYTNVDGDQVHVPVQAPSAPAGATAQCRDGSWSFSQHHSGTCSHHGGVAHWLG